eukprot:TRINITY_DN30005_c0_g1_i2.p1 TRINITY_DN30005_c0_g1~~TRINITY_DN30005_c0_g1_i2.p1  ORF type:complete len:997 (-),score=141.82 TRINITY_DN30005_c0_g1_i2:36-3026(-)
MPNLVLKKLDVPCQTLQLPNSIHSPREDVSSRCSIHTTQTIVSNPRTTQTSVESSLDSTVLSSHSWGSVADPSVRTLPKRHAHFSRRPTRSELAYLIKLGDDQDRKPNVSFSAIAAYLVEHKVVVCVSVALTFWAIAGDDIRLGFTERPLDPIFNWLVIGNITFFALEMFLSVFGKADYFLSFFFFLDLISTLSLLLDLDFVTDKLAQLATQSAVQPGNAARVGAIVGRVVRVLRLVRIVKLYKAHWDQLQKQRKRQIASQKCVDELEPGDEFFFEDEVPVVAENVTGEPDTLVGKKLSALTLRRVIIMILTMLLVLPQFSSDGYLHTPTSASWGIDSVWKAFKSVQTGAANRSVYEQELLTFAHYHNWFYKICSKKVSCAADYHSHAFWFGFAGKSDDILEESAKQGSLSSEAIHEWQQGLGSGSYGFKFDPMPPQATELFSGSWHTRCEWASPWGKMLLMGISLLAREISDAVTYTVECPEQLRPSENIAYGPLLRNRSQGSALHFVAFFDQRPFIRNESVYSLLTTLFICIVLFTASLVFAHDTNVFVLQPLENMMRKVNAIRENPLIAMKIADQEFKREEVCRASKQHAEWIAQRRCFSRTWHKAKGCFHSSTREEGMETMVLEKTIIKLGTLLALGFGEAGANIVQNCLSGSAAGVNVMVPGKRVDCFISVVRVSNFLVFTEVLRERVMTFINQIAEIVHGVVDQFGGACNKSNGDSFLLIWQTNDGAIMQQNIADMSVFSLVRILSALHQSRVLARYRGHPCLQQRLGSDCRVSLSFGIHYGWAIVGAVGSEFKIDASYLSPTVSVTGSVERATHVYNVSIIATMDVISRCSMEFKIFCRLIDNVQLQGSKEPISFLTVDLDHEVVEVLGKSGKLGAWNVRRRFLARQLLELEKLRKREQEFKVASLFVQQECVRQMREIYTTEFLQTFIMGYQNYSEGQWQVARRILTRTRSMLASGREDGPSRALLGFMEQTDFEAPKTWRGVRVLEA